MSIKNALYLSLWLITLFNAATTIYYYPLLFKDIKYLMLKSEETDEKITTLNIYIRSSDENLSRENNKVKR